MEVREASANYSGLSELPDEAVPFGYRQTEVGVIPKDWNLAKLGDYATFRTGPFGSALHKADYVENGVPVINPMQIDNGRIFPTASMAVTEAAARKLSDFRLTAGEVVIGRRGEMGRCAVVPAEQAGWLCGTGSMIVRAKPSLDAGFIQRVLSSPPIISAIESASVGSTMINLNQGTLANLLVALPPLKEEQEAIAEALSDADTLIESLEQLIAKKRQIKQGAMQALLTGKQRLPSFIGPWQTKLLQEVADCLDSLRVPLNEAQRERMRGDYPYCGANGVLDFIDDYVIDDDVILIAEDGGYFDEYADRPIAYRMTGKCWVNNHAHILKAKYGFDQGFVFYALVNKNILSFLASGTRAKLNKSEMNKIEICLPPGEGEQTAIATILTDMDTELAELETRLAKTRQLKQGMMQELLTGRIRLV